MLFDIEELDPIWVRVPVYVGDRRELDLEAEARVGDLAEPPGEPTRPAGPGRRPAVGRPAGGDRQPLLPGRQRRPRLLARPAGRRDDPARRAGRGAGRPPRGRALRLPRRGLGLREDRPADLRPAGGSGSTTRSATSPSCSTGPSPAPRSSPTAPPSCSAPSSAAASSARRSRSHDLAGLDLAAAPGAGAGAVGRADDRRRPDGPARAAGRLPRVRAAAGRDPDRGAGALDRGGREPDHRCRWRTRSTASRGSRRSGRSRCWGSRRCN